MAITAKDVNALRQKTGMGMMECKKALTDADGDVEQAVELLRERAGGKMDTREAEAGEGAIAVAQDTSGDGHAIAMVKVMTETDFSARNEGFLAKLQQIADEAVKMDTTGPLEPNDAIKALVEDLRLTIKEGIVFGQGVRVTGDHVASYVHTNRKSAAVVSASGEIDDELLRGICMHVTAAAPPVCPSPLSIDEAGLPPEKVDQAKASFVEEAAATGKPAEIAEKIAGGKMNKWISDHTLLGQTYIKEMDAKKPVKHYLPKDATISE
ncbi:MAG: translation elongation factor Ts, partial [Planctomycetota bacterium]